MSKNIQKIIMNILPLCIIATLCMPAICSNAEISNSESSNSVIYMPHSPESITIPGLNIPPLDSQDFEDTPSRKRILAEESTNIPQTKMYKRQHLCQACGTLIAARTEHQCTKHNPAQPDAQRKACPICGKLISAFHLALHKRTHTREKPFECKVCNARFTQTSNLAKHQRKHTEERSFKCTMCGDTFTRSDGLARHQSVHQKDQIFDPSVCEEQRQSTLENQNPLDEDFLTMPEIPLDFFSRTDRSVEDSLYDQFDSDFFERLLNGEPSQKGG